MNVSIGILAHNEAGRIEGTLRDLAQQSLICNRLNGVEAVEIICVVNGSTDDTANVVRAFFRDNPSVGGVNHKMVEIPTPGKVNAWNDYVHHISFPQADYLVLMDADIRFNSPDVLAALVGVLKEDNDLWATVSIPVKDISLKEKKTFFDRISVLQSKASTAAKGWLCGQLYAIRAPIARKITLPKGLLGEDGFLALMINSDLFARDPFAPREGTCDRIGYPEGASHIFSAYTRVTDLLRQGRRQAMAQAITLMLREQILTHRGEQRGAEWLQQACQKNPDWFLKHIRDKAREQWWVMPRGIAMGRLKAGLRRLRTNGVIAIPYALAGFSYAAITQWMGNMYLRRHMGTEGAW